jgi:hypothetical protein
MMLAQPKVSAETPSNAQGDTEDRPRPTPRMIRISESAAEAAAPARIAPQDTALCGAFASTSEVVTTATVSTA